MTHRNFHTFEARDHIDLGHQLGECFGSIQREYLKEVRDCEDWGEHSDTSQRLLKITRQHFPEQIEELQAYAAAANLPFLDLWTMMIEEELSSDYVERCTTVITNGGRLVAHNEDWDADAAEDICIVKKSVGTTTILELYYYGCPLGGVAMSIHSNGIIQTVNSLDHSDWQPGIPKAVFARRVSECRNIDRELEGLLALPRSSGFAHNLVDRYGAVTSIECTARRHCVTTPSLPFVHTNHMLSPALVSWDDAQHKKSTNKRYGCACELVASAMNEDAAMGLMSNREHGKASSVFNRNTIARGMVDLERRQVNFWLHRESDKGWVPYSIDFLFE
jgi:Acyl-coenzyme A:6-aminopenicillanic acid acyl-transferase